MLSVNKFFFSFIQKVLFFFIYTKSIFCSGIPYVTDCIVGELEKLGQKFKLALKIVKDPRFQRIQCMHPGTYADDCLVQRVVQVCE